MRRENVESLLSSETSYPIIVVTAPAGYGKSTQISHWVSQTGMDCAWISLDRSHNDLGVFLQHIANAVDTCHPVAAEFLRKQLRSAELAPSNFIADSMAVQLEGKGRDFILVLDDYHEIDADEIHLFVESLLMNLPDSFRIAIVSRRTPRVAMSRLRAQGLVLDIRLQDLQFDRAAIRELTNHQTGLDINDKLLDELQKITEGWPAGLRMLLMARAKDMDLETYLARFDGQVWQIQEFLVEEVLRQLPVNVAKHIGITAILGQFSSQLCQSLIGPTDDEGVSGKQLVELIRSRSLFCIPLDEHGEWYRYHPLFRDLLLKQLSARYNEDEIRQLHCRAAAWLDNDGQIEEAIQHYCGAGEYKRAADVVSRHSNQLIVSHQWRRLDRVLRSLPTETIEREIELVMLLSWTASRMGRVSEEIELAQTVRDRIDNQESNNPVSDVVNGMSLAQYSIVEYFYGHGEASLDAANKALDLLPAKYVFARAEAAMMQGVALQMRGNATAGRNALLRSLERSSNGQELFRARILIGHCYLSWVNGDLRDLQTYAATLLELGRTHGDDHAIVHASWFGGAASYQLNKLSDAADMVAKILEQKWWPHHPSYSYCVEIMAMIHLARGEHQVAIDMLDGLLVQAFEARTALHIANLQALQAEISFAAGNLAAADRWANDFELGTVTAGFEFSVPQLTVAKILLQSDQTDAREKAASILSDYQTFYEQTNNIRFLVETLALQALQSAKSGDEDSATKLLGRAVTLAEPSTFIRVFVDLGPTIVPLLNRLEVNEKQLAYVGGILAGFRRNSDGRTHADSVPVSQQQSAGLIEALSKREQEVLALIAQRMTNKEIGEELYIAPETVKRHAHNIFEKLNVNDRRAARAKAIGLGLVTE